jgi:uncharacterized DUF497 family protein
LRKEGAGSGRLEAKFADFNTDLAGCGKAQREIERVLGVDRKTIRRIAQEAKSPGVATGICAGNAMAFKETWFVRQYLTVVWRQPFMSFKIEPVIVEDYCMTSSLLLVLSDLKHSEAEPRFHALGTTLEGRRLRLTFTLRNDEQLIRVISARDMHRKERVIHEQAS